MGVNLVIVPSLNPDTMMFGSLRFHYKRSQLQRAKDKIRRSYEKEIAEAERKNKGQKEIETIYQNEHTDLEEINDDIADLLTSYYCQQATRNYMPIPSTDEEGNWTESRFTGRRLLTPSAVRSLRAALRQESKDNSELARMWLAGLTGLVGALVGLAALLFKH
jgi:hypothetical protein